MLEYLTLDFYCAISIINSYYFCFLSPTPKHENSAICYSLRNWTNITTGLDVKLVRINVRIMHYKPTIVNKKPDFVKYIQQLCV